MRTADKWLRICNCLLRPERVAVKRRPARVHPPQWGTERLPATVQRVRATVSHTVVIPYGHRGIYIPPPVIHPPDSSLQRCQVTSTASLRSHVHSPVCTNTSTQPGWGKPRFTSTCSDWRGISKPLAFKERLELLSRVSRAKSFDHSFPVGAGVNCL